MRDYALLPLCLSLRATSLSCGEDHATGTSYEHRRQWIEDRLIELSSIFSIDLASYAVMSNHYHVVLHIDRARASNWPDMEVIERWHLLYSKATL